MLIKSAAPLFLTWGGDIADAGAGDTLITSAHKNKLWGVLESVTLQVSGFNEGDRVQICRSIGAPASNIEIKHIAGDVIVKILPVEGRIYDFKYTGGRWHLLA